MNTLDGKPLALIIEDHADQNIVFTTALKKAGYGTESILDGITAQKRLLQIAPQLIILDLHIPGISGDALLEQVRNDPRLENALVILATADAALADVLQPQADLVLLKPISFAQLSELASRFLARS